MRWINLIVRSSLSWSKYRSGAEIAWRQKSSLWRFWRIKTHSVFAIGVFVGIQIMDFETVKAKLKNGSYVQVFKTLQASDKSSNIKDSISDDGKRTLAYNFIADAVEKAAPAVVYIEVVAKQQHYFHNVAAVSSGSGFIVSSDGMVITNAHVINQAYQVNVKLSDGRNMKGVVVDVDPVADLAAVKLVSASKETFPHLCLGNSSKVRAGEWVAALGSPLRLSNTVTSGIVSSLHRPSGELGLRHDMTYIQTDAAINIGNSGGPLINLDGEVIGINCITVAQAAGISFAIPSNVAKEFLEGAMKKCHELERKGWPKVQERQAPGKFYIGLTMLTLTSAIVDELSQRSPAYFENVQSGVFVARVVAGSPAARGGMKVGDVITSINDKPVESAAEVHAAVKAGNPMTIGVMRGGKLHSVQVVPGDLMSRL